LTIARENVTVNETCKPASSVLPLKHVQKSITNGMHAMPSLHGRKLSLLFLVFITLQSTASAHPNNRDPEGGMEVYLGPDAKTIRDLAEDTKIIRDQAQTLYHDIKKHIKLMADRIKANQPVAQKDLSEAAVKAAKLKRIADVLTLVGEPAGTDYSFRLVPINAAIKQAKEAFVSHPANQSEMNKARSLLEGNKPARPRETAKVQALVNRGEFLQAETAIYGLLDQLKFSLVLIPDADQFKYAEAPWGQLAGMIDEELKKRRREQAAELLAKKRAELLANAKRFLGDLQSAAAAIRSSGTVTVDGQALGGPSACKHFAAQWESAHIQFLQARAYEWGRYAALPSVGINDLNQIEADFTRFTGDAVAGFVGLIDADTQRISNSDDVSKQYVSYLVALSPLAANARGEEFDAKIQAALDSLAAKSTEVGSSVAAYKTATAELLRWRNRVAVERAQVQIKKTTSIEQQLRQVFVERMDYQGLFTGALQKYEPLLYDSAPMVLRPAAGQLIGKPVTIGRIAGMPNGKSGIGRFHERGYAMVSRPSALDAQVEALRADLMVGAGVPPLSLEAAEAIMSAKNGDCDAGGGEVMGIHLEGLITRFATLSPAAVGLVSVDEMPAEDKAGNWLARVVVRCDVVAQWMQHKYFFIDFKPTAGQAE
jgi:hypothetical protein